MQRINPRRFKLHSPFKAYFAMALLLTPCAADQTSEQATLSPSAYRTLGQPDLRQNGVNIVDAGALSSPQAVTVDSAGHLYVADTLNHRVLAWSSAVAFQTGDQATLVLGQATPRNSGQLGIGAKGF